MEKIGLPVFRLSQIVIFLVIFIVSSAGILHAWFLFRNISKRNPGTRSMQEKARIIRTGIDTCFQNQLKTMLILIVAAAAVIFLLYMKDGRALGIASVFHIQ